MKNITALGDQLASEMYPIEVNNIWQDYARVGFRRGFYEACRIKDEEIKAAIIIIDELQSYVHSEYCTEEHHPICSKSEEFLNTLREKYEKPR